MTTNIEDLAHVGCEELTYLLDGYTVPTETTVCGDDTRYAGMTAKQVAKCERWVRWASLKSQLAQIHSEVSGKTPLSSIC